MSILKSYFKQMLQGGGNPFDIVLCTLLYGASPNNYREFDFANLNSSQRATYVTNQLSRKMIKKFNNPAYEQIFEDKTIFAVQFANWFNRRWVSTQGLTKEMLESFIMGVGGKAVYKPANSAQGIGIKVYENPDINLLWKEISNKPKGIFEEWIEQHEALCAVYPKAVNCLRIITVYQDGMTYFLTGGITWGCGDKIANASASGIVSPVDFETGILNKPAADFNGNIYRRHPYSGANLVGFRIPYWNETLEMLKQAAANVPEIGYVGWDIAITSTGPTIIEGNTTPGYKYYQIPTHLKDHIGNKPIYEQYL